MATRRSRSGNAGPSDRRHIGMTLPRQVKADATAAAGVMEWSVGDWVLAAAAEFGPQLRREIGRVALPRRPSLDDPAFAAIYLTTEERAELDDQAIACGLNRSAFVTAVARLGLGEKLEVVVGDLLPRSAPP